MKFTTLFLLLVTLPFVLGIPVNKTDDTLPTTPVNNTDTQLPTPVNRTDNPLPTTTVNKTANALPTTPVNNTDDLRTAVATANCAHGPTSRKCWRQNSIDTNWYNVVPDTGVTREYWLSVVSVLLAPDGYERQVMTFNGTLPGPLIQADWGDNLVIHVTNNLVDNGTAVHWHGIQQRGTPNADGAPGVTQCPIAPGYTMTYRFKATQYGSSLYHAHFTLQMAEGMIGPIVINGPATANYDVDLGPVMIQDWSHISAFTIWRLNQKHVALPIPVLQNGLINGMNPYDCSFSFDPNCKGGGDRYQVTVTKGLKYRMRLIGAPIDGFFKFHIDGHKFKVIAVDFVPIVPYTTDNVVLTSGQRYDIVVEADQVVGNYWIRAIYMTACNQNDNLNKYNIRGIFRYDGADVNALPTTLASPFITNSCGDELYWNLVPWVPIDVGGPTISDALEVQWHLDLDLTFHWTLHTKTLEVNWSDPTTRSIYNGDLSLPYLSNVYTVKPANKWAYWIIEDFALIGAYHPMHLHGHDFFVLAQGLGPYIPFVSPLNKKNPPRRDTVTLYGGGYTVIAMLTDNPGSWLLHCHIAWHTSQGLAMQIVERPDDIPAVVANDFQEYDRVCKNWDASRKIYKMDDSGI
ncbi:laccase precursor [Gonapodya prolifera JEL478]|uniref:Laccase n=1 Tax=Gonapodya prolifera (strain JEL478) TaxID=1344416 RepID=A0A139AE33_GONPJ|nr:laccase precursor [Gonapodya prolifera JEL478]|eukprot:KXS14695.1 laccase precursor [Gonapodya prolifera JEL478]